MTLFPIPALRAAAAALATTAALAFAGPAAQAGPLYSNFNPLLAGDAGAQSYQTDHYADISGYCANYFCTSHFNIYSASFKFTAQSDGQATHAYLPLEYVGGYPGMERFYRISILNSQGQLMVQGGLLGRHVGLNNMDVYEFELNRDYESGQVLAASGELEAGETYTAYFHQRFGSLSRTHWMSSQAVPASGQAQAHCRLNTGGVGCASNFGSGWVTPWGAGVHDLPITDFLPALALSEGAWQATAEVPEPGSLPLVAAALVAGLSLRLRRPVRAAARPAPGSSRA
jgi:hypothetical protein